MNNLFYEMLVRSYNEFGIKNIYSVIINKLIHKLFNC